MYGCNHGDWLVVRSLGEECSVGMCQTDRGAHIHCRANQKPAVSLKTISYITETTYESQISLVWEQKEKGHFETSLSFYNTFIPNWFDLRVPGWESQTLKWWIYIRRILLYLPGVKLFQSQSEVGRFWNTTRNIQICQEACSLNQTY